MMSIVSSRYDVARFGAEVFRSSLRQADLLIVSGRVSHKMTQPLREIYDQMLMPKWVIAMGACSSSAGCSTTTRSSRASTRSSPSTSTYPAATSAGGADRGDRPPLQEKIQAGVPPAYEIRGVAE